jgi:hypothetical protein
MVYFGPIHLARLYFIDMGYVPANCQTTPDFLVSVTDPLGRTTKEDDSGSPEESADSAHGDTFFAGSFFCWLCFWRTSIVAG